MIYGLIGLPGSGKTLFLTVFGYIAYRKGYRIMSNYKLNFPHEPLSLEKLSKFDIQKAVLLWDEIHTSMDSRRSMDLVNMALSYLVLQARKRELHIAYTTQILGMVDLRLRNITNYRVLCEKDKEKKQFKYTFIPIVGKHFVYVLPYYKASKFIHLYDTSQYYDVIEIFRFSEKLREKIEEEKGGKRKN